MFCLLPKKKKKIASCMKEADYRDMLKNAYMSIIMVSPDPLSPPPRNSSPIKTPENTEQVPDDAESSVKEISK
jgi:hypothetical protein